MVSGGNVWNNIAVYPLWVTMAAGMGLFSARVYQWISYDQDIQVTKDYRGRDPADSDFLLEQGTKNYNHPLRNWLHSRPSVMIFPEPGLTSPATAEN